MSTPAIDQPPENSEKFQGKEILLRHGERESHLMRKALVLLTLLMLVSLAIVAAGAHVGAHGHDQWYARFIVWIANLIRA